MAKHCQTERIMELSSGFPQVSKEQSSTAPSGISNEIVAVAKKTFQPDTTKQISSSSLRTGELVDAAAETPCKQVMQNHV